MDDNIKKIMDKIDGEIETADEYIRSISDMEDKRYFQGKEQALEDLKTWIQENIIKP